jgi:hypothetical protein
MINHRPPVNQGVQLNQMRPVNQGLPGNGRPINQANQRSNLEPESQARSPEMKPQQPQGIFS